VLPRLIAIAVLLLLNGFFVAAEFALVRSRRTRLESMARTGDWKARLALRASGNLARVYSASQLGVTLASLALGALAESSLGGWMAGWLSTLPVPIELSVRVGLGATIALAIVTFFHVVFGELAPRGAALSHPEGVARWLTPPLLGFAWIATPFTSLLNRSSQIVLRLFGQKASDPEENVHSAEELRMLVEQSQEVGVLQTQDADMLEGVFEFSEKNAREVMTPRTEIDALDIDATLDDTLALVEESGRSRYPVYEETIDNIIGLVLAKEPPKQRIVSVSAANQRIKIPAGDPNYSAEAIFTVRTPMTLVNLFPHLHLRGKAFQYEVIYPDGRTDTILKVDKWDLNWQLAYTLAEPLPLPTGTRIKATAWWDNSANNPANPDPKVDVAWGEQSWEEMLVGFMNVAVDPSAPMGRGAR